MENRSIYPLALYLANDARDREMRDADRARRVPSQPRRSIRQAVGQSLVRVGARLAGEPSLELARFR
ncbi:MAG TPA: hypothetical protein VKB00_10350 [Candidatus Limnocylindrales bacterium]|jgi:hypothetical protein|nr:hypothetical protein [Candidatus Limnocylindrales bacterium]